MMEYGYSLCPSFGTFLTQTDEPVVVSLFCCNRGTDCPLDDGVPVQRGVGEISFAISDWGI